MLGTQRTKTLIDIELDAGSEEDEHDRKITIDEDGELSDEYDCPGSLESEDDCEEAEPK